MVFDKVIFDKVIFDKVIFDKVSNSLLKKKKQTIFEDYNRSAVTTSHHNYIESKKKLF